MAQAVVTDMVAKKLGQLNAARKQLDKARDYERPIILAQIDRLLDDYLRMTVPVD